MHLWSSLNPYRAWKLEDTTCLSEFLYCPAYATRTEIFLRTNVCMDRRRALLILFLLLMLLFLLLMLLLMILMLLLMIFPVDSIVYLGPITDSIVRSCWDLFHFPWLRSKLWKTNIHAESARFLIIMLKREYMFKISWMRRTTTYFQSNMQRNPKQ